MYYIHQTLIILFNSKSNWDQFSGSCLFFYVLQGLAARSSYLILFNRGMGGAQVSHIYAKKSIFCILCLVCGIVHRHKLTVNGALL